jgi:hypothetical protein
MPDSAYELAEFKALSDEMLKANDVITTTMNFTIVTSVATIGFLFQVRPAELSIIFFAVPFGIVIPALANVVSRILRTYRISAYIEVFLEAEGKLNYQTRAAVYASISNPPGGRIFSGRVYRLSIVLLYAGISFVDIGLFWVRGYYEWQHVALYLVALSPLAYGVYFAFKNWRDVYWKAWQLVRNQEISNSNST